MKGWLKKEFSLGKTIVILLFISFIYSLITSDGGSSYGPSPEQEQRWREAAWMEKGKEAVRYLLKDPDSAKFRNVFFHKGPDGVPMTCGEVNSRNAFGAYAGFQHFISAGKPELTYLEEQVTDFAKTWKRFCYAQPKKPVPAKPKPPPLPPHHAERPADSPSPDTVRFICNNAIRREGSAGDVFGKRSKVLYLKDGAMLAIATRRGQQYRCTVDKRGAATLSH